MQLQVLSELNHQNNNWLKPKSLVTLHQYVSGFGNTCGWKPAPEDWVRSDTGPACRREDRDVCSRHDVAQWLLV